MTLFFYLTGRTEREIESFRHRTTTQIHHITGTIFGGVRDANAFGGDMTYTVHVTNFT